MEQAREMGCKMLLRLQDLELIVVLIEKMVLLITLEQEQALTKQQMGLDQELMIRKLIL